MKVFISGVTGFIGKNLYEHLNGRHELICPPHKELELLDPKKVETFFKENKIDVVVHCAAMGSNNRGKMEFLEPNLRMFMNVLKCSKYYKKLIHIGSGAEYDKSKDIVGIKEEEFSKSIPQDPYGLYKYTCSKLIGSSDGNIINLRPFGVFGKYEDYGIRFISNNLCRSIFGMPVLMKQNVYFDYLYINDFVKIIEYFIINDAKHKYYNVGRGTKIDLLTIARKINKISKNNSEMIIKNQGLNHEYTCNIDRLRKEVKGLKFTDFDVSLAELYGWYKKNKNSIDSGRLGSRL